MLSNTSRSVNLLHKLNEEGDTSTARYTNVTHVVNYELPLMHVHMSYSLLGQGVFWTSQAEKQKQSPTSNKDI
jgi:hypothetical protein